MDWRKEFEQKLLPAEEAVRVVKSGDRVVFNTMPGSEPKALGLALAARREELRGVELFVPRPIRDFGWYDPGWEESFSLVLSNVRRLGRSTLDERRCDYAPSVHFCPEEEPTRIDVLFTEVSTPDENGFCSFGHGRWNKRELMRMARTSVAQINSQLIRTYGDNFVHVSEIDCLVPDDPRPVREPESPEITDTVKSIAGYVSGLVNDGDTVEVGGGGTTEALPMAGIFEGRHDLGIHSEFIAYGMIQMVKEGLFTGKFKTLHQGKAVATSCGGTPADLKFVNQNPLFELYSSRYTHNVGTIAAHDNMVAINNALAIDLTGQVTGESIGPRIWSGPGGQPNFAIGALSSRGGRSITVLPSTAAGGSVSRIVPVFEAGTVVTLPRTVADIVVTEYGIARLRGRTVRERARELIAIAHPDFRAELRKEAQRLFWP